MCLSWAGLYIVEIEDTVIANDMGVDKFPSNATITFNIY